MSGPSERTVRLAGGIEARIQEQGSGERVGFLGGLLGLPRWLPFLDRLAERRRVIAPALPGFFGADGFRALDDIADWVTASLDLLEAAELEGADLVGASVGATLAAEVAAFASASVRRLVLIAPFGLFDPDLPVADIWGVRSSEFPALVSNEVAALEAFLERPGGEDEIEWRVRKARSREAAARLLWPTGDLGLVKRLHRVRAPTLLLWGDDDRVVPPGYARRFADGLGGYVESRLIAGAGHMAELDRPDETAEAVLKFLG